MLILYSGVLFAHLLSLVQPFSPRALDLSDPIDEERDESDLHKRSNKLKYGKLEHTHLDDDYVKGSLWPLPQEEIREQVSLVLNQENFKFTASGDGKNSKILKSAIDRYKNLTFPEPGLNSEDSNMIKSVDINVKTKKEDLHFDMDESCKSTFPFA